METLLPIVKFGIYAVMALSVVAAVATVSLPNMFHAALALAVTLIGVATIFFAMEADFIGIIQILVYVGAVMTLVIFAVMLTQGMGTKNEQAKNQLSIPAIIAVGGFFAVLVNLLQATRWSIRPERLAEKLSTIDLGYILMLKYVFAFEVIAILLLAVLIGAIVVAKKDNV